MKKKSLDEFLETRPPATPRHTRPSHPKGFEPGIIWSDDETATVTTGGIPEGQAPEWENVLNALGVDPAHAEIVGPVSMGVWGDSENPKRSYRAKVRLRVPRPDARDISDLVSQIRKHKFKRRQPRETGRSWVLFLSDLQVGKGEGGGSRATVDRIMDSLDSHLGRAARLRPERIVIAGMGDIIEGCSQHYAEQSYSVDLDRRDQERLAYELVVFVAKEAARLAPQVTVAAVPGNHGEKSRSGGKSVTSYWHDNSDVAVFETAGRILKENESYDHVNFVLANDLDLTLDVDGTILGLTHGHLKRGQPTQALLNYWRGAMSARRPLGDADILVSGHFHHLMVNESLGRTWFQCPASDGGSMHYTHATGAESPSGLLSMGVGNGYGTRGWGDFHVG